MIVEVSWDKHTEELELPEGSVVESIFISLNLPPDAFIATKSGAPIPITESLRHCDRVKLIRVASGG